MKQDFFMKLFNNIDNRINRIEQKLSKTYLFTVFSTTLSIVSLILFILIFFHNFRTESISISNAPKIEAKATLDDRKVHREITQAKTESNTTNRSLLGNK